MLLQERRNGGVAFKSGPLTAPCWAAMHAPPGSARDERNHFYACSNPSTPDAESRNPLTPARHVAPVHNDHPRPLASRPRSRCRQARALPQELDLAQQHGIVRAPQSQTAAAQELGVTWLARSLAPKAVTQRRHIPQPRAGTALP